MVITTLGIPICTGTLTTHSTGVQAFMLEHGLRGGGTIGDGIAGVGTTVGAGILVGAGTMAGVITQCAGMLDGTTGAGMAAIGMATTMATGTAITMAFLQRATTIHTMPTVPSIMDIEVEMALRAPGIEVLVSLSAITELQPMA
jgi:hypothetical protein